jgi:flagellar biogenesis protein FliO
MTTIIDNITAGLSAVASAVLGSQFLPILGEATAPEMPQWMQWLMGPLGALVGMVLAIWWLSNRLTKAETKADNREDERDADRKAMISIVEQNSVVLRDVKDVIAKCKGH